MMYNAFVDAFVDSHVTVVGCLQSIHINTIYIYIHISAVLSTIEVYIDVYGNNCQ